jgi:excisionase family DNA binding protein
MACKHAGFMRGAFGPLAQNRPRLPKGSPRIGYAVAVTNDQYLTPSQVAEELHVTVVTVRRWITTGQLAASKAGPRKWMVRGSDLSALLARSNAGAGGDIGVEASEDPSFRRYLVVPE